jgi:fibronectin-binding autotransporter adhesin
MKNFKCMLKAEALLVGAFAITLNVSGADKAWSGAAGDKLWNTPGNWSPAAKPTTSDDIIFGDADATGTAGPTGLSNNIVDASFANAIKSLRYTNTSGFHHTRLTNNLVVNGSGGTALFVGTGEVGAFNRTIIATLEGKATFAITNTTGTIVLSQGTNSTGGAGSYKATLNLTGLDTFSANVSAINQAINADGNTSVTNNRPCADLLLAKTNFITATTVTISESFNNGGAQSTLRLGQSNILNLDTLRVGSRKGNGVLNFNTGLSSPTVKFRNKAGTGRGTWYIGEDLGSASGTSATGLIDLTGGTVDAQVGTIYVGKGQTVTSSTGDGTGTLTFNLGTIDVNTLEIGYQSVGGSSVGKGTVNVNGAAVLKVNNDIRLGSVLPGNTDTTFGNLTLNGGTVTVAGNILDGGDDAALTTLSVTNNATLDLQPAGDLVPGDITVDVLNIGVATMTNWNSLATTNINVRAPATTFTVYPGQTLVPGPKGVASTLNVNGSLTLSNATLKFDLADSASPYDTITITNVLTLAGTNLVDINLIGTPSSGTPYTLMTYGLALSGGATNLTVTGAIANSRYNLSLDDTIVPNINLIISGNPSTLVWSGDGSANLWDLKGASNWDGGNGANTEKFYNLDIVTFDDSGSASPAANLVGTLVPASVNVSGTKDYTFGGSGKLSGNASLVMNDSGTLTILTTNDNSGTIDINVGTLQLGNGTTADGSLGTGPVNNNAALIFNAAVSQSVPGLIAGGGTILKKGPGQTRLSGTNTYSGSVTIEAGTLVAGNPTALGDASGTTTITSGGTLDISGQRVDSEVIYVAGAGAGNNGAIINTGASQPNAFSSVTMTDDTTFGGTGRFDINNPNSSTAGGLSAGGFKLTKVGTNTVSLWNNSATPWDTGLGDIDLLAGILRVQLNVVLGDPTKTITVSSNATLQFYTNGANVISKQVVLNGGACVFNTGNSTLDRPITLNNGTNVFDQAVGASLMILESIGGSGSLVKGLGFHPSSPETSSGTGWLFLAASNSFTGDVRIQTGTLALTNIGSVSRSPSIILAGGTLDVTNRTDGKLTLAGGQALKGAGTVRGAVDSPVGTTVSPGEPVGTLSIIGNVSLRGTTLLDITKTNTTKTADKLAVTGALDLGGTLTVTFSGNTALAAGDKFTLFSATSYANAFTTTNLPTLGAGLAWTNKIIVDGTIEVIATEPPTPPTITATMSPTSINISWPQTYSSYTLRGQTNPVSIGLSTNWGIVPGVVGNQVTIPVNPTNGTVFFQLFR